MSSSSMRPLPEFLALSFWLYSVLFLEKSTMPCRMGSNYFALRGYADGKLVTLNGLPYPFKSAASWVVSNTLRVDCSIWAVNLRSALHKTTLTLGSQRLSMRGVDPTIDESTFFPQVSTGRSPLCRWPRCVCLSVWLCVPLLWSM